MRELTLTLVHLYPLEMNIYGDRGNIIALRRRCQWRGIDLGVRAVGIADPLDAADCDVVCLGAGQDGEQYAVADDLVGAKGEALKQAIADGAALLAVCGGYQLLGRYFQTRDDRIPGIGLFDAWTIAGPKREIGDLL